MAYVCYLKSASNMNPPSQQGISGQHRADSDTTWQRRIAVGPTLARFFVLAGQVSLHLKLTCLTWNIEVSESINELRCLCCLETAKQQEVLIILFCNTKAFK